jgi:hypothetical protein
MSFRIKLDSVNATCTTSIALGPVHTTHLRATPEQLAAAWNRPLAEIRKRITRMGPEPTPRKLEAFCRWLLAGGMLHPPTVASNY